MILRVYAKQLNRIIFSHRIISLKESAYIEHERDPWRWHDDVARESAALPHPNVVPSLTSATELPPFWWPWRSPLPIPNRRRRAKPGAV
jgi:hypothetical protein